MIDHKQCVGCIYASWLYTSKAEKARTDEEDRMNGHKFQWCNCLDISGEPHKVVDGVCLSRDTNRADLKKNADKYREVCLGLD